MSAKPIVTLDAGGCAQAGVLLARKGQLLPSDKSYCCLPILYHVMFHSLGSRLFAIRKQTGLFYGAQGMLAAGARRDDEGMDVVCTTVEPVDAPKTMAVLQKMLNVFGRTPNITADELNAAQRWYEHTIVDALNSPAKLAALVAKYKRLYDPKMEYRTILTKHFTAVKNLNVDTVNALARRVFAKPYDLRVISK